jgi:hypothetical protein
MADRSPFARALLKHPHRDSTLHEITKPRTDAARNNLKTRIGRRITIDFFEERERGEHVDKAEAALAAGGLGERGGQHHHHRGDLLEEEPPQVAPERIHRSKPLAELVGLVPARRARQIGRASDSMERAGWGFEASSWLLPGEAGDLRRRRRWRTDGGSAGGDLIWEGAR